MKNLIQIDREILKSLTEKARQAGMPVGEFTNALLRREISEGSLPRTATPYKCPTFPFGTPETPGLNLDNALHISATLEDERVLGQRYRKPI